MPDLPQHGSLCLRIKGDLQDYCVRLCIENMLPARLRFGSASKAQVQFDIIRACTSEEIRPTLTNVTNFYNSTLVTNFYNSTLFGNAPNGPNIKSIYLSYEMTEMILWRRQNSGEKVTDRGRPVQLSADSRPDPFRCQPCRLA